MSRMRDWGVFLKVHGDPSAHKRPERMRADRLAVTLTPESRPSLHPPLLRVGVFRANWAFAPILAVVSHSDTDCAGVRASIRISGKGR
jgi:hypothetical protein